MEKLKKYEAYKRAQTAFGPWGSWSRAEHVAYGLVRGVPYATMERCSNDAPPWIPIGRALAKLGAWADVQVPAGQVPWAFALPPEHRREVESLVVWVHKTPRGKRMRPSKGAPLPPAATAS